MSVRAERLEDAYRTLSPQPLLEAKDFDAYYCDGLNALRGIDLMAKLALRLERSFGGLPFKALLMGHSGVGKSTELTRLTHRPRVAGIFRVIRFSVVDSLDPLSFQPFDVLLLMMMEVANRTLRAVTEGGAGQAPPVERLREVQAWFAETKISTLAETETVVAGEAGVGPDAASLWAKALGVFAKVRGEFKYASSRKTETVNYTLSRLDGLAEAVNRLLDDCNRLLREASGHEWLFIGEDFDKMGISPRQTEDFFVTYSNVLRNLRAHCIFTLPIALGYSAKRDQLPVPNDLCVCLPDIMVFHQNHKPHLEGRAALQALLDVRISSTLFAPGLEEALIVASGGNLRQLFSMISNAADNALLANRPRIEASDAKYAIRDQRTQYERRLGQSIYDSEGGDPAQQPTYEAKAQRLLDVYHGKPEAKIPSPELYSLLRGRAVQEFNGERWFGVHPLVVDILATQNRIIPRPASGPVPGGTE